jgi:hypothetical protein
MTRCSTKPRLQHVLVRHEQGATHAAEGYARSTGKPGVVLVTSGPGATNAITGIVDALMDSIPLVVITGQVATHLIGTDAFQECRHRRHHPLVHQAQLPGQRRGPRPAADHARGLPHRHLRPSGPGGHRHPQGRAVRQGRLSGSPRSDRPTPTRRAPRPTPARSPRRSADRRRAPADLLHGRRRHQRRPAKASAKLLREFAP